MAEQENGSQAVDTHSLDGLVSNLRWLWLFLAALFVVATGFLTDKPIGELVNILIIIGGGLLLNGLYTALLWAKSFPSWMAATGVVLDTVLAIVLLVLLEEHAQFLLPVVIFPVIIAGVRWSTEAAVLAAFPIVLGYAIPLISIIQVDNQIDQSKLTTALLTLGVNALTLFLAGATPGPFIRQKVELAQQKNRAELDRLRVANERGKLVADMALTLSSTLNYRNVLRATIDSAFSAMADVAGRDESTVGVVLLFEEDDEWLTVAAGRNISRTLQGRKIDLGDGLVSRTISTAESVITHQAQRDKMLTSFAPGCRSAICVPLRAGYNTYGVVLFCSTEPNLYNADLKALLTTFCSQAIIALQNAQLFEDVHREQERILEKEAEARRKLARDLHDGPTQSIAAIAMRLNFIKMVIKNNDLEKAYDELVKVEEIAQSTTQEIRTMLFTMRPVILETQGLVPALEQYAERLNNTESFEASIINRGYKGQLSQEGEGVVFAIIEEAVGNAKKHAEASHIRITLSADGEKLFVEIRDNGLGFDVDATKSTYDQRTSLGLINMAERAELVGGSCLVESARGKGTAIRVDIPFHAGHGHRLAVSEPALALLLLLVSLFLAVGASIFRQKHEQFMTKQWPAAVALFLYRVGLPYLTLFWDILKPELLGLRGIDYYIFVDWSWPTLGLQLQQATTLMLLTWLLDSSTTIVAGLIALALLAGLRRHLAGQGAAFPASSRPLLLAVIYDGLHWSFYRAIFWRVTGDLYLGVVLGIGAVLLEETLTGLMGQKWRQGKPEFFLNSMILILTATIFFYSPNLWLLWPVHLGLLLLFQAKPGARSGVQIELAKP